MKDIVNEKPTDEVHGRTKWVLDWTKESRKIELKFSREIFRRSGINSV